MTLVAGIDSSTQSCKVVVLDAETRATGARRICAAPDRGRRSIRSTGGTHCSRRSTRRVDSTTSKPLSVGGQQHGLVALDEHGEVIRPALLWNDLRSASSADDLVLELGEGDREAGAAAWAQAVGSVPVASLTVTKLRWLADHEPENASPDRRGGTPPRLADLAPGRVRRPRVR